MKLFWLAPLATACALAALSLPASAAIRSPVPVSHVIKGQHTCSYTSPEYMLSDWDMDVHTRPGTTHFHAEHTPVRGYEDAYWVTGYHNENSSICDRRHIAPGVYGRSWVLPVQVRKLPLVTADLRMTGTGRLGFDIWLTASPRETGPHQWKHDSRTWEILLEPVHRWTNFGNPGWHRIYLAILPWRHGVLDVRALDITRIIRDLGVPRNDWLTMVGAGGETPYGSFTVWSYSLHIGGQHPKPTRHPRRHHRHHHKPKHHKKHRKKHPKPVKHPHKKPPVTPHRTWPNCYRTQDPRPRGTVMRCIYYRA